MREVGIGECMEREGFRHHGIELRFDGKGHRIDFSSLTGGKSVMVYAQHEVTKDLVQARVSDGGQLLFGVVQVSLADLDSTTPKIPFRTAIFGWRCGARSAADRCERAESCGGGRASTSMGADGILSFRPR